MLLLSSFVKHTNKLFLDCWGWMKWHGSGTDPSCSKRRLVTTLWLSAMRSPKMQLERGTLSELTCNSFSTSCVCYFQKRSFWIGDTNLGSLRTTWRNGAVCSWCLTLALYPCWIPGCVGQHPNSRPHTWVCFSFYCRLRSMCASISSCPHSGLQVYEHQKITCLDNDMAPWKPQKYCWNCLCVVFACGRSRLMT